jgi:acylphosphatase
MSAVVRGRVQGVGFRAFVRRHAAALQLRGWVANRSDGAVDVLAWGPRAALEQLLAQLDRGPAGARVSGVEVHFSAGPEPGPGFDIGA